MRVLTLDSALAHVSAGVVEADRVIALRAEHAVHGQANRLAILARGIMDAWTGESRHVAVVVGPGGFTGIRASLALAHGLALGADVPVIGVTVGEALAAMRPGESCWTAIDSKRGRVFLDDGDTVRAMELSELPIPAEPIEILGDAAPSVAAALRARGADARAGAQRWPEPLGIARAALARLAGRLPAREAQPLYVDPPAVKPPPGGLRPEPVS